MAGSHCRKTLVIHQTEPVARRAHYAQKREIEHRPVVGMPRDMNADTMIAMAGLMALGAAAFTGAIWDSPLVVAAAQPERRQRSRGRHAMPAAMRTRVQQTAR